MTSPPATGAGDWPLSAASTAVLTGLRTPAHEVLRLTVRELVVCGAWRLARDRPPRRFHGKGDGLRLVPTGTSAPDRRPLAELDGALRAASPEGGSVREVVERAVKADPGLAERLRGLALDELVDRRLVEVHRGRLRTRRELTATGRAWAASPAQERSRWRTELAAGRGTAVLGLAVAAPGLSLTADRALLAQLDAEVARRGRDGELVVDWPGADLDSGLADLGGLDAAVDGGSGDGGGDGGGGD